MKFLCLECDEVMGFAERQLPGDGTLAVVFTCRACGREIAMLTNPMETQLVSSLGVQIGGRTVPEQPMELLRKQLADPREDAFAEAPEDEDGVAPSASAGPPVGLGGDIPRTPSASASPRPQGPVWTPEALARLERVPRFVRGMVKRIYGEYAREHGIREMTPESMDRARTELGLEGM